MNITKLKYWQICSSLLLGFVLTGVCPKLTAGPTGNEVTENPKSKDTASKQTIQILGIGSIPGTTKDLSGLTKELVPAAGTNRDEIPPGRTFHNDMFGGISAITWTGQGNTYWMLPDRGPLDGAVDWTCRLQKVKIDVDPKSTSPVSIKLVKTIILTDRNGLPFTGLESSDHATAESSRRLDPEGIRVGRNGNLFIADEYGPHLIEFTVDGKFVRELSVDASFLASKPNVSKPNDSKLNDSKTKANLSTESGRQPNRGMEGLAVTSDQNRLVGLMQSPLLQDSFRKKPDAKPTGINCRMPIMAKSGECLCEHVYQLDNPANKLNEILNCGEEQFLVIERDGAAGDAAAFKKLMLISTKQASDCREIKRLPHFRTPNNVAPVGKEVLIDLLDEHWQLAGADMPEKIEGLAFGPVFDADHRLLLVASDNDFVPEHKTQVYVFAIPKSRLVATPPSVKTSTDSPGNRAN